MGASRFSCGITHICAMELGMLVYVALCGHVCYIVRLLLDVVSSLTDEFTANVAAL